MYHILFTLLMMIPITAYGMDFPHLIPGSKEYINTVNAYLDYYQKDPKNIATFLAKTDCKVNIFALAWRHQHPESIDYFCTYELQLIDSIDSEKREAIFERAVQNNSWHNLIDYCISKKWYSYTKVIKICRDNAVAGATKYALEKINPSTKCLKRYTYSKGFIKKYLVEFISVNSEEYFLLQIYKDASNIKATDFIQQYCEQF